MAADAEVTAAEIARLAGVGRAAVSNWRRRHQDFPQPIGGSHTSPTFKLADIQAWLHTQGKQTAADEPQLLARELAALDGDASLSQLTEVARVLRRPSVSSDLDRGLRTRLREAAADLGGETLFDQLLEQLSGGKTGLTKTPTELAALMVELAGISGGTVLDPACGTGTLLYAAAQAGAERLDGQDVSEQLTELAAAHLAFSPAKVTIRAGDSLRADAFPDVLADSVLCDPPFGHRDWGFADLAYDPRWEFGQPPRQEPELAWAQHCLAHTRPGGAVVLVLPTIVNSRSSGRRIRAELVRHGVLRAVIGLPAGVLSQAMIPLTVWVLRRLAGETPPDRVLLVDASTLPRTDWNALRERIVPTWQAFSAGKDVDEAGVSVALPAIDLLDDAVDLSPSRHLRVPVPVDVSDLAGLAEDLRAALAELTALVPTVSAPAGERSWPTNPIGDLVKAGAISMRRGQPDPSESGVLVLSARDVVRGELPSGRAEPDDAHVLLEPGDIVVPMIAPRPLARVIGDEKAVLGRNLQLLRPNPEMVDADFLAGFLRSGQTLRFSSSLGGAHRLDVRRVEVPILPLAEQRRLGTAFARVAAAQSALRRVSTLGEEYFSAVTDGLAGGQLQDNQAGGKSEQ